MKPRSDATLKTLPQDQQQQIMTWLKTCSQTETLQHIRQEFGLRSSSAALSRFYSWFQIVTPLDQLNHSVQAFLDREPDPSQLATNLDLYCQATLSHFALQARNQENPALLRQVIQMRLAISKAEREQAKFADEQRYKRFKLLQEIKDRDLADQANAELNQNLNRRKTPGPHRVGPAQARLPLQLPGALPHAARANLHHALPHRAGEDLRSPQHRHAAARLTGF